MLLLDLWNVCSSFVISLGHAMSCLPLLAWYFARSLHKDLCISKICKYLFPWHNSKYDWSLEVLLITFKYFGDCYFFYSKPHQQHFLTFYSFFLSHNWIAINKHTSKKLNIWNRDGISSPFSAWNGTEFLWLAISKLSPTDKGSPNPSNGALRPHLKQGMGMP